MDYQILRILFRFDTEYKGSPIYISGNALRHALSQQVNASVGCFTRSKYLNIPETYENFFKIRTEKPFLIPNTQTFFSNPQKKKNKVIYFTPAFVTFDIISPPDNFIEYIKSQKTIQLGGLRNEGFGVVKFIDHAFIDLNEIELPERGTHITLISPIHFIPKYVQSYNCRQEYLIFWNNSKKNLIKIISPGQFFRLKNDLNVKKIAVKGILRKTWFGQFGFGEFIVNNWPKEEKN